MSVGFLHAVADGLRYNGVPVILHPGYATRGNGFTFPNGRPRGCLVHHTGGPLDSGLSVLLDGRPDLDPPLCNSCGHADGTVRLLAAQVANHAGASGGNSMGPLPITNLFNPMVWGHEIMYPGSTPMTPAQYRSALILGGVICGILGVSIEHIRFHSETSRTRKWDAGSGAGFGIAMSGPLFRSRIWGALTSTEESGVDDMSAGTQQIPAGTTELELCMPTGKASGLVHTAWLGVSLSKGGRIDGEAYNDGGTLMRRWGADAGPHRRIWHELPDGATSYAVKVTSSAPASAGWCFELRPRKDIAR